MFNTPVTSVTQGFQKPMYVLLLLNLVFAFALWQISVGKNNCTSVIIWINFRCGLVALHMAADMLRQLSSTVCDQSLTDIFQHAVECKMTKQGEMFSSNICLFYY